MTEAKVAITDDLMLDFTGLFSGSPPEAPESPAEPLLGTDGTKDREPAQKPAEGQTNSLETQQAVGLFLKTQREREAEQRSLEVYTKYQENTIQSGKLQTEIIKGTMEGESIYILFLKAIQAISIMISDPLFYATVEENMLAIHGEGLKQEKPLKMELEAVERRLKNLMDAIKNEDKPEDVKRRIESAIKAHKERAHDIQTAIEKV